MADTSFEVSQKCRLPGSVPTVQKIIFLVQQHRAAAQTPEVNSNSTLQATVLYL